MARMTRMIFVRHGQSVGNLNGRFLGNYDGELTGLGRRQAERAAEYLKEEKIDIAYASDLVRAYETGAIIAAPHGLVPIKDKKLREIFAGKWENEEFSKIEELYPDDWKLWREDIFASRPTGGESVSELFHRITSEVWSIASENDGKTVLVATHATPIRALMREWQELGSLSGGPKWVANASITVADYDPTAHSVNVIKLSDSSFLDGMLTDFGDNV